MCAPCSRPLAPSYCDLHSRVAGRRVCALGSPIVICTLSVVPVRVGDVAVRVLDGAAIVIHRQPVDCARVGDGTAVAICRQDVVPCHVGRVV